MRKTNNKLRLEKVNIDIKSKVTISKEDEGKSVVYEKANTLTSTEINEIKEYIYSNYEISKENIYINR